MTTTTHSLGRRALLAITLALAALFAGSARADEALVQPGDSGTGALLLRTTEAGRFVEAPRLRTDVAVTVTGTVARARVTQVFENPSDQWVEGLYVFPLPADAGVDTLRMQVGNRFLEGQVKERKEARQIYERAAAQGTKATLIEQQRPNLFTNSVANIDPHGTVVVQIEYQHVVRLDGDQLSLRVPLVVAPRSSRGVFDPAAIATPRPARSTR
jgi:Ca-activated chloride channel family protein